MLPIGLKLAFRRFFRNRLVSFINVLGLAVGFAFAGVIMLHVRNELRHDSGFPDVASLYRITVNLNTGGRELLLGRVMPPMGPKLVESYPVVQDFCRFRAVGTPRAVRVDDEKWLDGSITYADSSALAMFGVNMVQGSPTKALNRPNTVIVSQRLVDSHFHDADPIGKTFLIQDEPYEITGVFSGFPEPSHLQYISVLASYSSLEVADPNNADWFAIQDYTYIKLIEGANPDTLTAAMNQYFEEQFGEFLAQAHASFTFSLTSVKTIHFDDPVMDHLGSKANRSTLALFSTIAAIILLLAVINYINLTTARISERSREVGISKVLGARRFNLFITSISESLMLSLLSLGAGIGVMYFVLSMLNRFTSGTLHIPAPESSIDFMVGILAAILVGMLAGLYPAIVFSAFQPTQTLKGNAATAGVRKAAMRRTLVVAQFVITIALLASTVVVQLQMRFISNKSLGFDKDQVLSVWMTDHALQQQANALKQELLKVPGVEGVSMSRFNFGQSMMGINFKTEEMNEDEHTLLWVHELDADAVKTLGLTLVDGRDFRNDEETNSNVILINEAAAKHLGWEQAVGQRLLETRPDNNAITYTVVGVVGDFHIQALYDEIQPVVIRILPYTSFANYLKVRVSLENLDATLKGMEAAWNNLAPDKPFDYTFMSEVFAHQYMRDQHTQVVFTIFSFIAILLTILGVLGLITYTVESRSREISIRKVLGASVHSILSLFYREFVLWVVLAGIIAVPLSLYVMQRWLSEFAYHVSIGAWIYIATILLTLALTLAVVTLQTIGAALKNPGMNLRHE